MAKRVIWSNRAELSFNNILLYWYHRNQSNTYSIKLSIKILEKVKLLSEFPYIGKKSNINDSRITHVDNYLIVYEIHKDHLYIESVLDGRREF